MRQVVVSLAAALALALPARAPAQAGRTTGKASSKAARQSAPPAGRALRIDYVEDSLPNGLKVLYHVDRSTPVAAVDIWYNVGSKNEAVGRTGFAHLFEHIMFKGSKNVAPGEHFTLLSRAGGRPGADINGTTSFDRTNYFEQVPSNQLELALWLEADRMGTLLETLTPEKLESERANVKNERRQSYENQPYGMWWITLLSHVMPEEHPYHNPPIGSMRDLSAATLQDVQTFFKTYYAPNNAVLVVAGDVDVAQTKAWVRKYFAAIPRGPAKPALADMALPPTIGSEVRQVLTDANAPAPAVYVAYRVPPAKDSAAAPAVTLLGSLVADGRSARLYKSLVRERQLAASVFGGNFGLTDGADMLFFAAIGKPDTDPDSLERALLAELDKVRDGPIAQEELDRVRAGQRFQFVDALQTTGGFGGRADRLAESWTYYRNPNWVNTVLAQYDAVTVPQLKALAASRMVPLNRVTVVYLPAKQQESVAKVVQ